jgi:hypothetical protein
LNATVAPIGVLADTFEKEVEANGEYADGSFAEAVVGDVAEPELLSGRDRKACHLRAVKKHVSVAGPSLPGDRFCELPLPASVHARDSEDLALVQLEGDVFDPTFESLAGDCQATQL